MTQSKKKSTLTGDIPAGIIKNLKTFSQISHVATLRSK